MKKAKLNLKRNNLANKVLLLFQIFENLSVSFKRISFVQHFQLPLILKSDLFNFTLQGKKEIRSQVPRAQIKYPQWLSV